LSTVTSIYLTSYITTIKSQTNMNPTVSAEPRIENNSTLFSQKSIFFPPRLI